MGTAVLVIVFWFALAVALVAFLIGSFRKALTGDAALPLLRKLERRGLPLDYVQDRLGMVHFGSAVRRCALCPDRQGCESGETVDCPNEQVLNLARRR